MAAPLEDGLERTLRRPSHDLGWMAVWIVLLICCAVELTLQTADAGLIGSGRWRSLAYQNGAFWAGLLQNWRPNYPGQPGVMFLTYAFLHTGFWHLAGNMLSLLLLARIVLARTGQGGFLLIYAVSAFGGALLFALLARSPAPMVGASGALFGLAGAWQYWEARDLRRASLSLKPVWKVIAWLLFLNVLMWILNGGLLAWETHLGGFLSGGMTAWGLAQWRGGKVMLRQK